MFKEILQILKPRFKCNKNEIEGLRDYTQTTIVVYYYHNLEICVNHCV